MPRSIALVALGLAVVAGCGGPAPSASSTPQPAASVTPAPTPASTATAPSTAAPSAPPVTAAIRNPAALTGPNPYAPPIDPADFGTTIDNPLLPWVPGTTWTYEGDGERIEIVVTPDTRVVMGVTTVVVTDQVFADGKLTEDTQDWYAQDRAGNVWYFGEATVSYEDDPAGDPAGSWEAGVDGAQPGVVMLADPWVGDVYRQEYLVGEAEDLALVWDLAGSITVPFGAYPDVLVTQEWTPLSPGQIEHKSYARGIGLVGEELIVGGKETVVLVDYQPAG